MIRKFLLVAVAASICSTVFSQGLGIPSKKGGIGFGNLHHFAGLRFNFRDKNVEKITGVNVTVWQPKDDEDQTGVMNGISVGVPVAMGTEDRNGIGVGIAIVGAKKNLTGLNVGGLGVGAGGNVKGITIGGLGAGAGGSVSGLTIGGLGAGSGGDVKGITIGGLGAGSGGNLRGITIAGLGAGAGGDVSGFCLAGLGAGAGKSMKGISIGGLGAGAGEDMKGITIGGLGAGAGGSMKGITIGGIGAGSGKELSGIAIAGIAAGSPRVRALIIAPAAGGNDIAGFFIVPVYLQAGSKDSNEEDVKMGGVSIGAVSMIKGTQKGVTIGVFNYARKQRGFQLVLLNYVKDNPKGLRLLPVFNMHFGSKNVQENQP
jgi:hypothetical protein